MSTRIRIFTLRCSVLLLACDPTVPVEHASTKTTTNAAGERTVTRVVNGVTEGRTLAYWPIGVLKGILYFHHDSLEGIQRYFYANGRLAVWQQAHRGSSHGKAYGFLENGQLDYIKQFVNGQQLGPQLLFYPRPPCHLHIRTEFIEVNGEGWQNSYAEYDTLGRVVEGAGFPRARAVRDTVALGDSLTLHLWIRYPERPDMMVVLGNFDAQFRLRDSTGVRLIPGRNHAATVQVPATQRGRQVLRGYLSDYRAMGPKPQKGKTAVEEQRRYFVYSYFVR